MRVPKFLHQFFFCFIFVLVFFAMVFVYYSLPLHHRFASGAVCVFRWPFDAALLWSFYLCRCFGNYCVLLTYHPMCTRFCQYATIHFIWCKRVLSVFVCRLFFCFTFSVSPVENDLHLHAIHFAIKCHVERTYILFETLITRSKREWANKKNGRQALVAAMLSWWAHLVQCFTFEKDIFGTDMNGDGETLIFIQSSNRIQFICNCISNAPWKREKKEENKCLMSPWINQHSESVRETGRKKSCSKEYKWNAIASCHTDVIGRAYQEQEINWARRELRF